MRRRLGYGKISKCLRRSSVFSVSDPESEKDHEQPGHPPGPEHRDRQRAGESVGTRATGLPPAPPLAAGHAPGPPGQYVAVHEGKVIASGRDRVEVAVEAYERVGYVSLFVGMVAEALPRRRVRVPSPRVRRGSMPV